MSVDTQQPYVIATDSFEGPIDLLYQLIEQRKLQINSVGLAAITESYLRYVEETKPKAEDVAQFIHSATILILIKSKSLLPILEYTKEEDVDVANLERLVQLYGFIQSHAVPTFLVWQRRSVPTKAPPVPREVEFSPDTSCTPQGLREEAAGVLKEVAFLSVKPKKTVRSTIRIEEVVDRILNLTAERAALSFNDLVKSGDRTETILSFLAILELARKNLLQLSQGNRFDDITIERET